MQYINVPGLGRQLCDHLFFIDAFRPKNKKADVPISAWGVPEVAKPSDGAPVPDLLRFRFKRPSKRPQTAFAQAPGVIELLVGQDYAKWFPVPIRGSMEGKDDLFFMRVGLSPYEIIYGEATVGLVAERRMKKNQSVRKEYQQQQHLLLLILSLLPHLSRVLHNNNNSFYFHLQEVYLNSCRFIHHNLVISSLPISYR